MYDFVLTIGCFDQFHYGHINILKKLKKQCNRLIIGIHDNESISKIKNISNIQSFNDRKKNVLEYADEIFEIFNADPTECTKSFINSRLINNISKHLQITENSNNSASNKTDNSLQSFIRFSVYSIKNTIHNKNVNEHCDPTRNNAFWVYPKHMQLSTAIWDTYDALSLCPKSKLISTTNSGVCVRECLCKNNTFHNLNIGIRSKHHYLDNDIEIYNERDFGGLFCNGNGYGRMVIINGKKTTINTFSEIIRNKCNNGGTEDYRYFKFNNQLFVLCNGICAKTKTRQMFLYNVNDDLFVKLFVSVDVSSISIKIQKNWTPYIYNDEIYFIHSYNELCVLKVIDHSTGECSVVYGTPRDYNNAFEFFGSTPLIHWIDDLFIGFAHSRTPYFAIPIIYDAKLFSFVYGKKIKISLPFKVIKSSQTNNVQFPYDFKLVINSLDQKEYVLSVGFEDRISVHLTYNIETITNIFHELLFNHNKNNVCCFMRADDNTNFPGKEYIANIMPIKYIPYTTTISATQIRNIEDKIGAFNYILKLMSDILTEHEIPYYIDCGTLLGCIRDNKIMEKDTDVDITTHLSCWDKLKAIDFTKYGLILMRTLETFPKVDHGNMISVKSKNNNYYCDIYTNPGFPLLCNKTLNGNVYPTPVNPELYLEMLYGKSWKIPSNTHASTVYHRNNGLLKSEYKQFWDPQYKQYKCVL